MAHPNDAVYQSLKAEKNRLVAVLSKHSDMIRSPHYKALKMQLQQVREQIKNLFRK